MDLAQTFIFDAGWFFFAAWAMVLLAVSAFAFGRDILRFKEQQTGEKNPPYADSPSLR
jgi:hypothetical protein